MNKLGFDKLHWQMVKLAGEQSLLFLGLAEKFSSPDNALGTFRLKFGRTFDEQQAGKQPRICTVYCAGVADISGRKRVLAVRYNLTYPEAPITGVDVSVGQEEFRMPRDSDRAEQARYYNSQVDIPTSAVYLGYTAGLITQPMVEMARGDTIAIKFSSRSDGNFFGFKEPSFMEKRGFYLDKRSALEYIIGSNEGGWAVSVPRKMAVVK